CWPPAARPGRRCSWRASWGPRWSERSSSSSWRPWRGASGSTASRWTPSSFTSSRSRAHEGAGAGLEDEGDGAVVDQLDLHVGGELAGLDGEVRGAQLLGEELVKRLGARGILRAVEARAVAL